MAKTEKRLIRKDSTEFKGEILPFGREFNGPKSCLFLSTLSESDLKFGGISS